MATVLLTGATGLVGKYFLEHTDHDVFAVTRKVCNLSLPFNFNKFPHRVDVVIHLAQSRHYKEFPAYANDIFAINTAATARLLQYAKLVDASQFIYASTGGVYTAGKNWENFEEDESLIPRDYYTASKRCSELLVDQYRTLFNAINLRPFFIYGKGQAQNMLIPRLIQSVKEGTPIALMGHRGIMINPIHVSDVFAAITKIINDSGPSPLNVAGRDIMPIKTICDTIGNLVGKEPEYIEIPGDPIENSIIGDISKLKRIHTPEVSFKDGVKEMI